MQQKTKKCSMQRHHQPEVRQTDTEKSKQQTTEIVTRLMIFLPLFLF